jgi:hypothetical protein
MNVPRMRFGKVKGSWRPAASLAGACALLIGGGVLTASPASAAVNQSQHVCEVIGNDMVTNAVICTDLVVTQNFEGSGNWEAQVRTEAFCQRRSDSAIVQCAGVRVNNEIADPSGVTQLASVGCGNISPTFVSGPASCSAGRNYFVGPGFPVATNQCHHNIWAVTEVGTGIRLPGTGETFGMLNSANLGTPHTDVGGTC